LEGGNSDMSSDDSENDDDEEEGEIQSDEEGKFEV
jgi:hypothetical protein